jgi:hypothetical protein
VGGSLVVNNLFFDCLAAPFSSSCFDASQSTRGFSTCDFLAY